MTYRRFAMLLSLMLSACAERSDRYPSREIKLIVQAAPGGLSDTVSRIAASLMEKKLGVPVVCENKPGAAGALAFSYVTRQPANGYTIGHAPVEIAMVRTLGYADVGPDRMDLLCLVSKTQPALVVHVDSPWKSLHEFVEAAKAKPGYYVAGNSGTGSIWHVNSLLLEQETGLRLVHCPFSGSSGALTALLGKHVDAVVAGAGEVVSHVKAGRMRVLAIFDQSRSDLFESVPSVAELGYNFGASAWSGFYGPSGMPAEARQLLTAAFREAYNSPEFQKICEERGMEPVFLDAEEFRAFASQQAAFFETRLPRLLRAER